jgi:hypothetical protein
LTRTALSNPHALDVLLEYRDVPPIVHFGMREERLVFIVEMVIEHPAKQIAPQSRGRAKPDLNCAVVQGQT